MIGGTWKGSNVCSEPVLMVEGFACDTEDWAVVTVTSNMKQRWSRRTIQRVSDDVVDIQLVVVTRDIEKKRSTPLVEVCW